MEIDFRATLDYGDGGPSDDESTPTGSDIARWIMRGMEQDGFTSVDVTAERDQ